VRTAGLELFHMFQLFCLTCLDLRHSWQLGAKAVPDASDEKGKGITPFSISVRDASRALHAALDVELRDLPSRSEVFFVTASLPHGRFVARKAKSLLGWEPMDTLEWHYSKL
jgi:hypothetical protein